MKIKILLISFLFLIINSQTYCSDFSIDNINLRPEKTVYLPKGTFIKVTNIKEISSKFVDEGDSIAMESTFDIYMGETNIIPKRSIFYGSIEKVREPVQGTNAAIVIKIDKLVTPDGISYPMNGYISEDGTNLYIGGERTAPLYYTRMPHYTKWHMNKWKVGAAQYCETNTRQYGLHTTIRPGAELVLILQDNLNF